MSLWAVMWAALCAAAAAWTATGPPAALVRLRLLYGPGGARPSATTGPRPAVGSPRGLVALSARVQAAVAAVSARRRMERLWRSAAISLCDGVAAELAAGRTPQGALAETVAVLDPRVVALLMADAAAVRRDERGLADPARARRDEAAPDEADRADVTWDDVAPDESCRGEVHRDEARRDEVRRDDVRPMRAAWGDARRGHRRVSGEPGAVGGVGHARSDGRHRDGTGTDRGRPDPGDAAGGPCTRGAVSSVLDVPALLDRTALRPGADGLRLLAACWRIGAERGGTFAAAVEGVADALREEESHRQEINAQLAGPRATARLLAGLPLLGLAMATGLGARPLGFLFGTAPGVFCLAAGVCLDAAGLWWTRRLAAMAHRPGARH